MGQHDIVVLADVPPPPPRLEKFKQVRATSDGPPPRNGKVEISGQCDILVLMYPPPQIEINMNAIENNWGQQVHFTNLPPPLEKLNFVQVATFPIFSHQRGSE